MERLFEIGLEATRWLQVNYPQLEGFLQFISQLGLFEFYLAVLPAIYWCIDKSLGANLTYMVGISQLVNDALKHTLRQPRPYWLEPELGRSVEETYGLPSSHVQTAAIFYSLLAGWLRRRWLWLLAMVMIFIMALSRVYLGVHFVHDAVGGFLLAALILLGFAIWRRSFAEKLRRRILGQRLLLATLVPMLFAFVYLAAILLLGAADQQPDWAIAVSDVERASVENVTRDIAVLFGLGIGMALESSRVRFKTDGPLIQRVLRYLLGMIVTLAIWRGLGELFPSEPLWLGIPLRAVRYLLLGLWATYYGPMLFVRLRLATAHPAPEVSLSL
jgi:membrane-associated phospholipid phosphatase